jgi:DNA repair exonuclease SbcCD nuclease subunit
MKVAIITDQHFGARNDSIAFLDFYEKFYDTIFFPTLEKEGIKVVLNLGDTFDRRKYVNFYALDRAKKMFFDRLRDNGIQMYMLAGNHDTYFKNTNEVNSPDLLLCEYNNITVIDEPTTIQVDENPICMMPWICPENYQHSLDTLKLTEAEICMGHFEIAGFAMYRGMESHDGLDKKLFEKFDMVFSGHYHHRSTDGHITYLGNPYELTWQDYNDPRGFHLFDLSSRKLTFVENQYRMFERFEYDDTIWDPDGIDTEFASEKFVKIVIVNKTDHFKFDKFMQRVYNKNPYEVKIIEDLSEFNEGVINEDINLEDTMSVLDQYIDSVETDVSKEHIKKYMKTLYTEAINTEVV